MTTTPATTAEPLLKTFDYPVRLSVFEGPLDLLLFLLKKNEVDIYDIPIATITTQYLDILRNMEGLKLEVAGEFFVMAAQLMHIKSRMLLPKDEQLPEAEEKDDDPDPRWELVQQLIEYKKFKDAAQNLYQLIAGVEDMLPRLLPAGELDKIERPLKNSDKIELWNTFNLVLRRLSEKLLIGEIHAEKVSVVDRMEFILEVIKTRRQFLFTSLFDENVTFGALVATFLAILELTRLRKLNLEQDENLEDITCTAVEETASAVDNPAPAPQE